jgi:hypothetical protein
LIVLQLVYVKETIECNLSVIFGDKVHLWFVQSIFVIFSATFRQMSFRPNGLSARRVSAQNGFKKNKPNFTLEKK